MVCTGVCPQPVLWGLVAFVVAGLPAPSQAAVFSHHAASLTSRRRAHHQTSAGRRHRRAFEAVGEAHHKTTAAHSAEDAHDESNVDAQPELDLTTMGYLEQSDSTEDVAGTEEDVAGTEEDVAGTEEEAASPAVDLTLERPSYYNPVPLRRTVPAGLPDAGQFVDEPWPGHSSISLLQLSQKVHRPVSSSSTSSAASAAGENVTQPEGPTRRVVLRPRQDASLLQRDASNPLENELVPLYNSHGHDLTMRTVTDPINSQDPGTERYINVEVPTGISADVAGYTDPNSMYSVNVRGPDYISYPRRADLKAGAKPTTDYEWLEQLHMWDLQRPTTDKGYPNFDNVWPWKYLPNNTEWQNYRFSDDALTAWPTQIPGPGTTPGPPSDSGAHLRLS